MLEEKVPDGEVMTSLGREADVMKRLGDAHREIPETSKEGPARSGDLAGEVEGADEGLKVA